MPFSAVSIYQAILLELRAFGFYDVAQFTVVVTYSLLLNVEFVKSGRKRVPETRHVAVGMECCPGANTRLGFARLQNEEKRVKTVDDLFKRDTKQCCRSSFILVEKVLELIWIGLEKDY